MISSSFFICSDSWTSSYLAEIFPRRSRTSQIGLAAIAVAYVAAILRYDFYIEWAVSSYELQ